MDGAFETIDHATAFPAKFLSRRLTAARFTGIMICFAQPAR